MTMGALGAEDASPLMGLEMRKLELSDVESQSVEASSASCSQCSVRRIAVWSLLATVVGCALLLTCGTASDGRTTARQLLEGPEAVEIATNNLRAFAYHYGGPQLRDAIDMEATRTEVASGFQAFSRRLAPDELASLAGLHISSDEKQAVLQELRNMADPRLQVLGRTVAMSLRESLIAAPEDIDGAHRYLLKVLEPEMNNIRKLKKELIPALLQNLPDERLIRRGDQQMFELHLGRQQSRRLDIGEGDDQSEEQMLADKKSILNQADQLYHRVHQLANKYGIKSPDVDEDLKKVDMTSLMTCFKAELMTRSMMNLLRCGGEFAQTAMHVVSSVKGDATQQMKDMKKEQKSLFDTSNFTHWGNGR